MPFMNAFYERLEKDRSVLKQVQPLLMPETICLSVSQVAGIESRIDQLKSIGFEVAKVSDTEIEVSTVPSLLKELILSLDGEPVGAFAGR